MSPTGRFFFSQVQFPWIAPGACNVDYKQSCPRSVGVLGRREMGAPLNAYRWDFAGFGVVLALLGHLDVICVYNT
jgi:hypothetical protein